MRLLNAVIGTIALTSLAGCGSNSGTGTSGGGGGRGGGAVGAVTVGPGIQFVSGHNGSQNPAVDTIAVGATVTWIWTGSLPHSVESEGATAFASSAIMNAGSTYSVRFDTPGTYQYDCAVHGTAMIGTIVVR